MKPREFVLFILTLLFALVLGACTAPATEVTPLDNSAPANDNAVEPTESTLTEVIGVIEEIAEDSIVVDSVRYSLTADTEFPDTFEVGDTVKLHVQTAADGTFFVLEIEAAQADDNSNTNENKNDNGNVNSNENTNSNSNDNSDDRNDNRDDSGNDNKDDD